VINGWERWCYFHPLIMARASLVHAALFLQVRDEPFLQVRDEPG